MSGSGSSAQSSGRIVLTCRLSAASLQQCSRAAAGCRFAGAVVGWHVGMQGFGVDEWCWVEVRSAECWSGVCGVPRYCVQPCGRWHVRDVIPTALLCCRLAWVQCWVDLRRMHVAAPYHACCKAWRTPQRTRVFVAVKKKAGRAVSFRMVLESCCWSYVCVWSHVCCSPAGCTVQPPWCVTHAVVTSCMPR